MKLVTLLSLFAVLVLPVEARAQAAGGEVRVPVNPDAGEDLRTRNALSQAEIKRLAEQVEQWNRVEGSGVSLRVAKQRTAAMLKVLNVACVVTNAAYRGPAPDVVGKNVYEAACEDGMGYLLMLQGSTLIGTSCLATGDESPVKCALPGNSDGKVIAARLLNSQHVQCTVQDFRWLGANAAGLDHVEVACADGAGYMIRTPHLGLTGKLEVFGCQDAVKQGVRCELSSQAASTRAAVVDSRPSLAWFKDALSRNGVSCQSKRARIVGRESLKRRYLVEFECTDRPEGLIAFVPSAGDTANQFESMSCPSAAERGIRCELLSGAAPSPQ
jgi:hypothetical protein